MAASGDRLPRGTSPASLTRAGERGKSPGRRWWRAWRLRFLPTPADAAAVRDRGSRSLDGDRLIAAGFDGSLIALPARD